MVNVSIFLENLIIKRMGSNTPTREELSIRNMQIYEDYQVGYDLQYLSEKYYLSLKSIQRIVLQEKEKISKDEPV